MNNTVMLNIKGGASSISGTLINAISRVLSTVLEIGRAIGSSISRYKSGSKCS